MPVILTILEDEWELPIYIDMLNSHHPMQCPSGLTTYANVGRTKALLGNVKEHPLHCHNNIININYKPPQHGGFTGIRMWMLLYMQTIICYIIMITACTQFDLHLHTYGGYTDILVVMLVYTNYTTIMTI